LRDVKEKPQLEMYVQFGDFVSIAMQQYIVKGGTVFLNGSRRMGTERNSLEFFEPHFLMKTNQIRPLSA
jgi:hypothetical protein